MRNTGRQESILFSYQFQGRLRAIAGAVLATVLFCAPTQAAPPEVGGLLVPETELVAWNAAAGAVGYNLYRGDVARLSSGMGDCGAGSISGTSTLISGTPAPGSAFTYLVSAFDETGEGGLGSSSSGGVRDQDLACVLSRRIFPPQNNGAAFDGVEDGHLAHRSAKVVVRGWNPKDKKEIVGVVASTGELIASSLDLDLRGRGLDWNLDRNYRSQMSWDGPLGQGWFFRDGQHLRPGSKQGLVELVTMRGQIQVFSSGPVGYSSPDGVFAVLHTRADSSLALRDPEGMIRSFHALDGSPVAGALEIIEDRSGGQINYLYDHQGLLTTVVDTLGRRVDYIYNAEGRISEVNDFDGRQVTYEYDTEGNLVTARSPLVTGTPNGNDFPGGKTTHYGYSTGFADDKLNHNLLTITDPLGQTWLTNTFSSDPDDPDLATLSFDRITEQTIGGTNASGVPAGGAVTYSYDALNVGAAPDLPDLERRHTLVTDPNGTVTEHTMNAMGHELTHVVQQRGVRPSDPPNWTTEHRYDRHGLLQQTDFADGGSLIHVYDELGPDRYRQGNLLEVRLIADPIRRDGHGGDQPDLVTTYEYDPVYNQVRTVTDPRGNDASYQPQNGGTWSASRYSTRWNYDYQEGDPDLNGINNYAAEWGIDLSSTELNLGDLNGDGRVDMASGSAIRRQDPSVTLDPASRQAGVEGDTDQQISTLWRHNDFGQVITRIDPVGRETTFIYHPESDPDGDGAATPGPPDGRRLDALDGGYLHQRNESDLEFLRRFYDPRGNPTDSIDGRGVRHVQVFNALDQLVESRAAAATSDGSGPDGDPPTGFGEPGLTPESFKTRFEYDANDNLVRTLREDRGNTRGMGGWIDSSWVFDALDRPVESSDSLDSTTQLVTQFRYDASGNLVRQIAPEGNEVHASYDERDLLYQVTIGAAGPSGGTPATTSHSYDGAGNLTRLDDPDGQIYTYEYDGLDRLVKEVDEIGGTTELFYDPASRHTNGDEAGTIGGPSSQNRTGSGNVQLSGTHYLYDEMNRLFRTDRQLGMPAGATTQRPADLREGSLVPSDGLINSVVEYDASGRVTFITSDHGATTRQSYDSLGRLAVATAPDGSETTYTYDRAHQIVEIEERELDSETGAPSTFLTTRFYDALGRLELTVDNTGRAHRLVWDSLSDLIHVTDPNGPAGGNIERRSPGHTGEIVPVNGHGNLTSYTYDGLSRRVSTRQVLTVSGQGDGTTSPIPDDTNPYNPSGEILRSFGYDGNSRLISYTNARGNQVSYSYDNLDRRVRDTFPGETDITRVFDARGNMTQLTDQANSVLSYTYDNAGRAVQLDITPAPGFEGTTQQIFEYDGASRMTRAFDNNGASPDDDSDLRFHYDLLGRLVEEEQRVPGLATYFAVDHSMVAGQQVSALTYPSGRKLDYTYDPEGRLTRASDPASTGGDVVFRYDGMSRVLTRSAGASIETTVGFDGNRQVRSISHSSGATLLAGFDTSYDSAGRMLSQLRSHHASGDLKNGVRLSRDSAGRLSSVMEALFDSSLVPSGTPDDQQDLSLDAEGNRPLIVRNGRSYDATPNNREHYDEQQCCGKATDDRIADDYLDDAATPEADGRNFAHDETGNQTKTGDLEIRYDALRRPVRTLMVEGGAVVARYRYDALGRMAHRVIKEEGLADEHTMIFHDGWRAIEERDESSSLLRQLAVTPSGDPLWQLRDFASPSPAAEHLLPNAAGSTAALATAGGTVLERMTYGTGGVPIFRDVDNVAKTDGAGGVPLASSEFGLRELQRGSIYLDEFGTRSADRAQDWGGARICSRGSVLDVNQGRALGRPDWGGGIDDDCNDRSSWDGIDDDCSGSDGTLRTEGREMVMPGDNVRAHFLDVDSDDDGLSDGIRRLDDDSDGDGLGDVLRSSDGGGLMDGEEDMNKNGRRGRVTLGDLPCPRGRISGGTGGGGAGGAIRISGRGARTGRNPQTGATIKSAARKKPRFKAGKALADTVKIASGGGGGGGGIGGRKARTGRNPQTGATIRIAAKKVAKFKAGAALAGAVKSVSGGGGGGAGGVRSISNRAARTGRNPQTGATIRIAAKKVAKFKAGAALAGAVKAAAGGGGGGGGGVFVVDSFFDIIYGAGPGSVSGFPPSTVFTSIPADMTPPVGDEPSGPSPQ